MRKWKAWLFALAVLIGIGTIGTASMKAEAQNLNQGKRVLFISSYSYGHKISYSYPAVFQIVLT